MSACRLRSLLVHSMHLLSADLRALVDSCRFEELLKRVDSDPQVRAEMLVGALKDIALDPLRGSRAEDFYRIGAEDTVFFVELDRVCNIFPMLALPNGSPEAAALIEAIRVNLASCMYKAAAMHRRLDDRRVRLSYQSERRAQAVFERVYRQARNEVSTDEAIKIAAEARRTRHTESLEHWRQRARRVASAASPGFDAAECFADWWGRLLMRIA